MMARLRDVLWNFVALLTITSTTLVEFYSSTSLLVAGVFLASSWGELSPGIPLHEEMLTVMPEWAWATAFLGIGLAQSLANLFRVSWARVVCASIAAASFTYLAVLSALVHPPSLLFPFATGAAVAQAVCFLVMSRARFRVKTSGESRAFA